MRKTIFEIDGFIIILDYVRCVYPVEPEKSGTGWFFGFKFSDGFYECFNFKTEVEAKNVHDELIQTIRGTL